MRRGRGRVLVGESAMSAPRLDAPQGATTVGIFADVVVPCACVSEDGEHLTGSGSPVAPGEDAFGPGGADLAPSCRCRGRGAARTGERTSDAR